MLDDFFAGVLAGFIASMIVALLAVGVIGKAPQTDDYERLCKAMSGEVLDLQDTLGCLVDGEILGRN